MTPESGVLIVVSGPSGAGKGTVVRAVAEKCAGTFLSVSATTRAPRPGEEEGVHYRFLERSAFEAMIAAGELIEYAEYNGNYYGTPAGPVDACLGRGENVILEIETKGAAQVKRRRDDAVLVFIMTPGWERLEHQLRGRGTESEEVIMCRLAIAREELKLADAYDYIVINDRVEDAAEELSAIILAERCRTVRRKDSICRDDTE
ncbi:guanylate kinase [Oscillospiraceae bacterium OttesenSCG-928-F05]|nr:guanylate kinase [Oscillospiraceae bacterium OttesenSCG-928-F05]